MDANYSLRKRDDRPQVRMTLFESTQNGFNTCTIRASPTPPPLSGRRENQKFYILLLDLLVRIDDPIEHPLHIPVPILRRLKRDRDQRHPRRRLPHGR